MDTDILQIIYENLRSWSFGFLVGFGVCMLICRVVLRHKNHSKGAKVNRKHHGYRMHWGSR